MLNFLLPTQNFFLSAPITAAEASDSINRDGLVLS